MLKLLKILIISSVFFVLISNTAQAVKKKKWYNSINVTGGITASLQGTSGNGDSTAGTEDNKDFSYSLDLNLDSEITREHKFFVHIETGEGKGINDNFGAKGTYIKPNYDPFNSHNPDTGHQDITVSQAFYKGTFFDEILSVDFGKMDIHSFTDQNTLAGNEESQFMAGIFVRLVGTLFAELDNYYSPGIRLLLTPNEWFDFTYVAANSSYDSVSKNFYDVGQITIKPNIKDLEGNYRFYYIRDRRNYTKIDDITSDTNPNSGWGLSFDQHVTENVSLFYRYGSQKEDLSANTATSAWTFGAKVSGKFWKRPKDYVGLGIGAVKKNKEIETDFSDDQEVTEIFYYFQLWDNLSITPDVQFHKNLPRTEARDITVYGVRLQFHFF